MQGDKEYNIIKVSKDRWAAAQNAELELWKKSANIRFVSKIKRFILYTLRGELNKIADLGNGDDWNFWWAEKFDNYSFLPKEIENALEVGCGPFTNIRLILRKCKIKRIHLNDPLIKEYVKYTTSFTSKAVKRGEVLIDDYMAEELPYKDNFFDLVISINVLDHVMDAEKVILECWRVTKKGGYFIIGQDLTDENDVKKHPNLEDIFHPIRIDHNFLNKKLRDGFDPIYFKVLSREEGRNPEYHYATFIFVGLKK